MKKKLPILVCVILVVAIVITTVIIIANVRKDAGRSGYAMFSWESSAVSEEEAENLKLCMDKAGVNKIYQQFSKEMFDSGEAEEFLNRMKQSGTEVYALLGSADWAYEENADTLTEEITSLLHFREETGNEVLSGVVIDIEPYLLDEWDMGKEERRNLMETYLRGMKTAYRFAKRNELEFIVCIPVFYDVTCEDILEDLVADSCDGIAVMNYDRTDEYGQMSAEVGFAREYGKRIICIFELQEPGHHDLEEINTYASEGLEALWQSADKLKNRFGYDGLSFAYHYYGPLKKMLTEK